MDINNEQSHKIHSMPKTAKIPWLDHTSNHYKIVTTMLIHNWNEHPNIQANKLNANYLHVQHSTNAQYKKYMHLGSRSY